LTTVSICVPCTALGALTGLAIQLGAIPGLHLSGVTGPGAFIGGVVGIIAGLTFSSLLFATERNKRLEQLRFGRFAMWGGLSMAAPIGVLFHNPLLAVTGALLGAVVAPVTLAIARRAPRDASLPPASTQPPASIRAPST